MTPRKQTLLSGVREILEADPHILSDTHFFHDRVFSKFEPVRQTFADSREAFDEKMFKVLRQTAPFFHLGDVVINSKDTDVFAKRIRQVGHRLQGLRKVLVMGNHDRGGQFLYEETGWFVVSCGIDLTSPTPGIHRDAPPFILAQIAETRVMFTHEPVLISRERTAHDKDIVVDLQNWFLKLGADINIHGHTHSLVIGSPLHRNVSVEAQAFQPMKLSYVVTMPRSRDLHAEER